MHATIGHETIKRAATWLRQVRADREVRAQGHVVAHAIARAVPRDGVRMTAVEIAARCGGLTIGGVKVGMRELIETGHVRARWDGEDQGWAIRLLLDDAV
ncbi:hypothetical protein ACVWZM_002681 [Bradyrhizobium sp. USDA 4501]